MQSFREGRKTKKKEMRGTSKERISRCDKLMAFCAFVVLFFLALFLAFLRDWYI
jgi:hypothetical protein